MANITHVLLKNLQIYNPSTDVWADVWGISTSTPADTVNFGSAAGAGAIDVYYNASGAPLTATPDIDVNFNAVKNYPLTHADFDCFGTGTGQVNTGTIKSPFLRYTLSTINTDGTTTDGSDYYYLMMSADLAADPFIDVESTPTVSGDAPQFVDITFWFPAVTSLGNPGIDAGMLEAQLATLQEVSRWYVDVTDGAEYFDVLFPLSVTVYGLTDQSATDYGMAKIKVKLHCLHSYPASGTYSHSVFFSSNDREGWVPISATTHDIAVTVTPYICNPAPMILSFDTDVKFFFLVNIA